jgi:hypothetical protein
LRDGALAPPLTGFRLRLAAARAQLLAHPWIASFGLFTAVAAVMRPATFEAPVEYDTSLYLYGGSLILHGGTPYVDMVATKGPVTYLLFALIRLVTGTSVVGIHIALVVAAGLAALALSAYVARFAGRAPGFLAGLVFAAFAATYPLEGQDSNTEQFGVAPMVGAWWLATVRGSWASAGTGALTAIAVLMNPAFAVVVPFVLFELWRAEERERARRFLVAAGGAVAVAAPIFLWLGLSGALGDMFEQVFGYADSGISAGEIADKLAGRDPLGYSYFWQVPAPTLWILGVLGGAIALRDPRLRRVAIPALLWIAVAWVRVKAANYSYPHHYYPVLPGIAAGIGVGVAAVARPSWFARAALGVLVLAIPLWKEVLTYQRAALRQPARARFFRPPDYYGRLTYPVADFIRANTSSDDKIYIAGGTPSKEAVGAPGVYWLAERFSPTIYIDTPPARWVPSGYRERRLRELFDDPPKAIGAMAGVPVDDDLRLVLDRYHYRVAYRVLGARVWLHSGL